MPEVKWEFTGIGFLYCEVIRYGLKIGWDQLKMSVLLSREIKNKSKTFLIVLWWKYVNDK